MKTFGAFTFDMDNACLWRNGAAIRLQPKPFAVLGYLLEHAGRLVTHDELMDALWPNTFVQPQVLRTYMLELRKLLGDDARQPRFIESIPKRGYRFVAAVTEQQRTQAAGNLVARHPELEKLHTALEGASQGSRQAVFLCGPAGIGKTALLDAFCSQLPAATLVARGQCVQALSDKEQHYPILEALAQLCSKAGSEPACSALRRLAPAWALPSTAEPTAEGARTTGALCSALEEIARETTLVLVLDDVHWADTGTVDLVAALAMRRAPARLMVVATLQPGRPNAATRLRRSKQELLLHRQATEIDLAPMTRTEITALLMQHAGGAVIASELTELIYQRAEGNPLFALSIFRHLDAQRLLQHSREQDIGHVRPAAPMHELENILPDELNELIELEVRDMAPADQHLLEAASLFPVVFPAWGVAAALDEPFLAVEESLDRLALYVGFVRRAGMDELPGGAQSPFYSFTHGLYREVLYRRQSPARRAQRHTRIAERLGTLFAGREMYVAREMALHHEAAGDWARAVEALQTAARFALERNFLSVAAEFQEQAGRIQANLA